VNDDNDHEKPRRLDELIEPAPRSVRFRIGVGAGVVLLISVLVVAVLVSMLAPKGSTQLVSGSAKGTSPTTDAVALVDGTGKPENQSVFVHVLGAVTSPGLFELGSGSRVIDAISAAGGFTDEAEQGGVNLARILADGEQLVVPKIGEAPPAAESVVAGSAPGGAAAGGKVSLNSASAAELEALPRIGPAMAARIVEWRTANGRFSALNDLLSVAGIGQKTFDDIKDLISL
jgi:competence protein ComEA